MTDVLRCCSSQSLNQPYIGVDQKCNLPAIFCIQHSPHKNQQGLMHQMLPLKHFKKTLQQKKFKMNQKIGILIDQYNNLMDSLIEQIRQLKLRKNIELSMLWLRQLAKDQQQYELMRQIYRMDFKDLTCTLIHSIYFKIIHNQILEKKTVKDIDCYKSISEILDHLSQQRQTKQFLAKKVSEIEGILQNGQILKRALPDKMVFKQNIKEVLLQSPHSGNLQIKYNKCKITKSTKQYISIFSKYPLIPHVVYHINFTTKYTNIMLGICNQILILKSKKMQSKVYISQNQQSQFVENYSDITQFDKHYSKQSIVFNCTNGCTYKDGMFQSGSNALTKGQKQLVLKLKIISNNQMIITLGKHVLCRQKIDSLISNNGVQQKLFLHILMRTEGDGFDVDRDKDISSDGGAYMKMEQKEIQNKKQIINPRANINYEELRQRNQAQAININHLKQQIIQKKSDTLQNYADEIKKNYYEQGSVAINTSRDDMLSLPSMLPDTKSQMGYQISNIPYKPSIKLIQGGNAARTDRIIQQSKRTNILLDLNPDDKQKKINQLIKRQRIDKILNDIKSKPGNTTVGNPVVAKKLKQIQEKNSNKATPAWRKNITSDSNSNNQQQSYMHQRNTKIQEAKKSNFTEQSSQNGPAQMGLKQSYNINPLFIVKRHQNQQKNSQVSLEQSIGGFTNFPSMTLKSPMISQKQNQKLKKPSQKSFRLEQDESYDFGNIVSGFQSPGPAGNFTPIDKINEFEFAKKSINLKPLQIDRHELFKPIQIKQQQSPKIRQYTDSNSQMNIQHSGSFNQNDKSEVIETIQVANQKQPKINFQNKMPQLQHSRFSKVTANQDLSHMESSFGGRSRIRSPTALNKLANKSNNNQNPMNRMSLLESIINIKSDYNIDNNEPVQIGAILSPKNANNRKVDFLPSQSSQIVEQSFQMGGGDNEEYPSYSKNGIRGTTK